MNTANPAIVTGAAGFIGSHLAAALLSRGRGVIGVDNFDPFYDRGEDVQGRSSAAGDASSGALSNSSKPTFVIVSAWQPSSHSIGRRLCFTSPRCAGVRPSIAEPAQYASVNVDGLVSVLDAARVCGCRNIIFASSSSVYGNNSKVPFSEDDAVDEPISPYAATKRAGELICHTYCAPL